MLTKWVQQSGQSVVEIIVALALFLIIAGGSVAAIVGSLTTTRLAEEESQATLYAVEGIEAVQSIRNQNWSLITNGTYGVSNSGGTWAFSGSSDDPDGSGKFTRVITISNVNRNSSGTIVSSGGTNDPSTKLIDATVSWDFTPSRNNSVSIQTYITDWQFSRGTPGSSGPTLTSCNQYCVHQAYTSGVCEPVAPPCANSGGVHKPGGDQFCTGSPTDTCCCVP